MLEHELPGARFFPFSEVWCAGLPVAPGQTWLSTRFSPHPLAASAGASGAAISISRDYHRTKHSSLIDLGSHWTLIEELNGPGLPTGGGISPQVVLGCHQDKLRLARSIYGPGEP